MQAVPPCWDVPRFANHRALRHGEKVDVLSRAKASENENPNLVDKDDEIPF